MLYLFNENSFKQSQLASPFKQSGVSFMNEPAFLNESVSHFTSLHFTSNYTLYNYYVTNKETLSLIFKVTFQLFKSL